MATAVQRVLESPTGNGLTFTSEVHDCYVYGLHPEDKEMDWKLNAAATVEWELELVMRRWGIKEFNIVVKKVHVPLDVTYYELDGERTEQEEITYDATSAPDPGYDEKDVKSAIDYMTRPERYTVSVEVNSDDPLRDGLTPRHIEVHKQKNQISIEF